MQQDISGTLRTLGLLLKAERVKRDNMSRQELADRAGVTLSMVGKVERGETGDLVAAWHMAEVLGREFPEMLADATRAAS